MSELESKRLGKQAAGGDSPPPRRRSGVRLRIEQAGSLNLKCERLRQFRKKAAGADTVGGGTAY